MRGGIRPAIELRSPLALPRSRSLRCRSAARTGLWCDGIWYQVWMS